MTSLINFIYDEVYSWAVNFYGTILTQKLHCQSLEHGVSTNIFKKNIFAVVGYLMFKWIWYKREFWIKFHSKKKHAILEITLKELFERNAIAINTPY